MAFNGLGIVLLNSSRAPVSAASGPKSFQRGSCFHMLSMLTAKLEMVASVPVTEWTGADGRRGSRVWFWLKLRAGMILIRVMMPRRGQKAASGDEGSMYGLRCSDSMAGE